jgi:hypothetical protein
MSTWQTDGKLSGRSIIYGLQAERTFNNLYRKNNLSDVENASTAAQNIGALESANNLSDLGSASTARSNLDVYSTSEADSAFLEDTDSKNIPIATAVFDGTASGDMLSGYGFSGRAPKNDCTRNAAGDYTLQIGLGNTPADSFIVDLSVRDSSLTASDSRDIRVVGISYNVADIRMEIDVQVTDGTSLVDVDRFYCTVRL